MRNIVPTRTALLRHVMGFLAMALPSACSESDSGSGSGKLDGADASVPTGIEGGTNLPEASSSPVEPNDAYSYPIDPNGPPPDCILPCVWEAMKRCPGPQPGQACVHDPVGVDCCPMDDLPAPGEPVFCRDESWVGKGGTYGYSRVYKHGERYWWLQSASATQDLGPPPGPAGDWIWTWYVQDEATGEEARIATVQYVGPASSSAGPPRGNGACYNGDEVVFTSPVDVTAEHCQPWFPRCDVPGLCPVPEGWGSSSLDGCLSRWTGSGVEFVCPPSGTDAGTPDAADSVTTDGGDDAALTPSDAATAPDAIHDAPSD